LFDSGFFGNADVKPPKYIVFHATLVSRIIDARATCVHRSATFSRLLCSAQIACGDLSQPNALFVHLKGRRDYRLTTLRVSGVMLRTQNICWSPLAVI